VTADSTTVATRRRRLYGPIVLGLLAAGAMALFAVTRAWATATVRTPGVPIDEVQASGADAAPVLVALAIVVIAAALAVVASGGWFRQLVGLTIATVAAWAAVRALSVDIAGAPMARALLDSPANLGATRVVPDVSSWPVVAGIAFAIAAALGLLVIAFGRQWPRMGSRYDRPSAAASMAPSGSSPDLDDADVWRALDDGHDPTL
jgi:uncharacterized membrane protein (TIGR02234 family)